MVHCKSDAFAAQTNVVAVILQDFTAILVMLTLAADISCGSFAIHLKSSLCSAAVLNRQHSLLFKWMLHFLQHPCVM